MTDVFLAVRVGNISRRDGKGRNRGMGGEEEQEVTAGERRQGLWWEWESESKEEGERKGSSVCRLLWAACLIWREYLVLDGGMLQSREGKNKVPESVCVWDRGGMYVCVIRCEVLGAALCSLKGSGWCPALCSSSTVLHVSSSSSSFVLLSSVLSFLPHPSLPFSSLLLSSPLSCFSPSPCALHHLIPGLLQQNTALQQCCCC